MDRRTLLLSGATLALAGCLGSDSGGSGGPGTDPDAEPTTDLDVSEETLESLVEGNIRFAFALYDYLRESEAGNLLASPYSVSVALAMTYAGARGETEAQIAEAMRFSLEEEIHPAFAVLYHELDARSEVETDDEESDPFELAAANAAWGLESYPYRDEYLELVERYYGAGFRTVDFEGDPQGAREEINEWVARRTEERINDLLPEGSIDELTRLVLTNALFFRATWAEPFEEERTEDAPFTALDGATEDVPIMRRDGSFPYAEVGGHQVIDLPYVGKEVGIVVVLPAEGEFERVETGLDAGRFSTLDDALEPREGTIALPRFGFESGFALKEALSALGMEVAFDEREANFDGIAPLEEFDGNLYVDDVYHDTSSPSTRRGRRQPRRRASSSARSPRRPTLSRWSSTDVPLRDPRPAHRVGAVPRAGGGCGRSAVDRRFRLRGDYARFESPNQGIRSERVTSQRSACRRRVGRARSPRRFVGRPRG